MELNKCETSRNPSAGIRSGYDRSRSRYPAAMVDPAGGSFGSGVTGSTRKPIELGGNLRGICGRAWASEWARGLREAVADRIGQLH